MSISVISLGGRKKETCSALQVKDNHGKNSMLIIKLAPESNDEHCGLYF